MAELAELLEEMMAMLQDALDAARDRLGAVGERAARVVVLEAPEQAVELAREILVRAVVRRQRNRLPLAA